MFIYKNETAADTLEEDFSLSLEGTKLTLEGHEGDNDPKLEIRLGPGEQKVLRLTAIDPSKGFGGPGTGSGFRVIKG